MFTSVKEGEVQKILFKVMKKTVHGLMVGASYTFAQRLYNTKREPQRNHGVTVWVREQLCPERLRMTRTPTTFAPRYDSSVTSSNFTRVKVRNSAVKTECGSELLSGANRTVRYQMPRSPPEN